MTEQTNVEQVMQAAPMSMEQMPEYKIQVYRTDGTFYTVRLKADMVRFVGNGGIEFTNTEDKTVRIFNHGAWRRVDFGENRKSENAGQVKIDNEKPFWARLRTSDPNHNIILFVNFDVEEENGNIKHNPFFYVILSESSYRGLEMDMIVNDSTILQQVLEQKRLEEERLKQEQERNPQTIQRKEEEGEVLTRTLPVQQTNQNPNVSH